jgi:hypothetical protein
MGTPIATTAMQQLRVLRASGQFGPLCSARPSQFTRATESIQCTCARVAATKHTHKRKPTHCTDPRRCAPRLHGGDCTGGEGGQPTPGRISDCMIVTHAISFFLGAGGHDHGTDPSGCCVGLCPVGSMASRDSSRCIRTVKCRRAGRVLP